MHDLTTTLLDVLGLLLFVAGLIGGVWPFVGAWALCAGGVVIVAASWYAASRNEPS